MQVTYRRCQSCLLYPCRELRQKSPRQCLSCRWAVCVIDQQGASEAAIRQTVAACPSAALQRITEDKPLEAGLYMAGIDTALDSLRVHSHDIRSRLHKLHRTCAKGMMPESGRPRVSSRGVQNCFDLQRAMRRSQQTLPVLHQQVLRK